MTLFTTARYPKAALQIPPPGPGQREVRVLQSHFRKRKTDGAGAPQHYKLPAVTAAEALSRLSRTLKKAALSRLGRKVSFFRKDELEIVDREEVRSHMKGACILLSVSRPREWNDPLRTKYVVDRRSSLYRAQSIFPRRSSFLRGFRTWRSANLVL